MLQFSGSREPKWFAYESSPATLFLLTQNQSPMDIVRSDML